MDNSLNLKYIGFIQEYNNIPEALPYVDVFDNNHNKISNTITKIVNYLDKGYLACSCPGVIMDLNNENLLYPDAYFTDGVYIWPSYFLYYLVHYPNFKIDKEFIDYLLKKEFKYTTIGFFKKRKLRKMENYLEDKLIGSTRSTDYMSTE